MTPQGQLKISGRNSPYQQPVDTSALKRAEELQRVIEARLLERMNRPTHSNQQLRTSDPATDLRNSNARRGTLVNLGFYAHAAQALGGSLLPWRAWLASLFFGLFGWYGPHAPLAAPLRARSHRLSPVQARQVRATAAALACLPRDLLTQTLAVWAACDGAASSLWSKTFPTWGATANTRSRRSLCASGLPRCCSCCCSCSCSSCC